MKVKIYKLNQLYLDREDWDLLNQISSDIKMNNSNLARLLLHQELTRIKALGISNFKLSITGEIKNGK